MLRPSGNVNLKHCSTFSSDEILIRTEEKVLLALTRLKAVGRRLHFWQLSVSLLAARLHQLPLQLRTRGTETETPHFPVTVDDGRQVEDRQPNPLAEFSHDSPSAPLFKETTVW